MDESGFQEDMAMLDRMLDDLQAKQLEEKLPPLKLRRTGDEYEIVKNDKGAATCNCYCSSHHKFEKHGRLGFKIYAYLLQNYEFPRDP